MCNLYIAFGSGDCYCIKTTLVECGRYRYRRFIGKAENTEPRWYCCDYRIIDCPWFGTGQCKYDHHAKIEQTIEVFDWTAAREEIAEKVGHEAIDMVQFDWLEDAEVLADKAR